jgi:hypothetical protein
MLASQHAVDRNLGLVEGSADPQREAVYAAEGELTSVSHPLRTINEVQAFLDEATTVIGEQPIHAILTNLEDSRIPSDDRSIVQAKLAAGQAPRAWGLAIPDERTILIVDAGQAILSSGLNALHEVTHVLVPTTEHHGAEFTRAFIDLLRRYGPYQLVAAGLESAMKVRGVSISPVPSKLSDPFAG